MHRYNSSPTNTTVGLNATETALKRRVLNHYTTDYGRKEGMSLRKLQMVVDSKDSSNKVQKMSIGTPSSGRPTKVIMLIGATGTGKTTLINAMTNFIFRVEYEDTFRLVLVDDCKVEKRSQAESQTDLITAYVFNFQSGMPFEYNYILIDTPGFGDTRGIQRDRQIVNQLESFLKQNYNINHVDGIGLVTPASAARLTQTQRYVFDGLGSLFGIDVKNNIYIMATFADAKEPPVLAALKEANVHFKGFYKFNNSALYACNKANVCTYLQGRSSDSEEDDDDDVIYMSRLYWVMGYKSLQNFFQKLGKTTPASLALTKQVLEERRKLQELVVDLQNQIQLGLSKLGNLHKERALLQKMETDVNGCRNYEEYVEVPKIHKIMLQPYECVTNCIKCNYTCHFPCNLPKNSDKEGCWAMTNGICRMCPGGCLWDVHYNMPFRFETKFIKEKRTVNGLLNRYNLGVRNVQDKRSAVRKIEKDINTFSKHLVDLIRNAQDHVEKLEEIALKPQPISTSAYIDLLIESEKMQKRHDFQTRINMLQRLKMEAVVITGVSEASALSHSRGGVSLLEHFKNLLID